MTALSGPVSGSFEYDAVGRRRLRTVATNAKQYLYDGLNPVQELASGTPVANLLTGLGIDEYFTRTDGAGVLNYLTDALGSSIALAGGSGGVQTEHTYEPFGSVSTSGAPTANTFGFTGREADGTGLYFYRARYYDPRLQRFVAEDPIGFAGGDVNLHGYVWNAPTRWTDPTGLAVILRPPWCRGNSGKNPPAWRLFLCTLLPYGPLPMLGPGAAAAAAGGYGAGAGAGAGTGAGAAAAAAPHLSKVEVQGLRDLFGNSVQGVTNLLDRLNASGAAQLPPGVTLDTLQRYRAIAERAIQGGRDPLGVQAQRLKAIDELLRRRGGG